MSEQKPNADFDNEGRDSRWQDLVDSDPLPENLPALLTVLSGQAFREMQAVTIAGQQGVIERLNAELETTRQLLFDVDKSQDIEGLGQALNAVHRYLIDIGRIER